MHKRTYMSVDGYVCTYLSEPCPDSRTVEARKLEFDRPLILKQKEEGKPAYLLESTVHSSLYHTPYTTYHILKIPY